MIIVLTVVAALLACACVFLLTDRSRICRQSESGYKESERLRAENMALNQQLAAERSRQTAMSVDLANANAQVASLRAMVNEAGQRLQQQKEESLASIWQQKQEAATGLQKQKEESAAALEQQKQESALLLSQQREEYAGMMRQQKEEFEQRLQQLREEASRQAAQLRADNEQTQKQLEERFKNIAGEILDANTRKFNESSSQKLSDLLSPLKENLENFRKVVGDTYNNESRERFSLQRELRELLELNKAIGREARDLTRALRSDSKVQGDWGEMILEQLLEKSGLVKGMHFDMQVTHDVDGSKLKSGDGGSLRADVVVYYPDDRCLVIDSKVSLTGFVDYINLADDPDDTDGQLRREAGRRHLTSVRNHITELQRKNYQDLIGRKKMDFVMMFIPNEAAYIAAMQLEPGLWQEAYDKRVLMVSPTHLISVLRMLRQLWKQDAINKNVEEIGRLAGRMIDKFVGMMDAFDDVEKHLGNAQKAYSMVRNRLSDGAGNIFITARKIQELGAKSTKQLPEK